jgi:hypothetical protein
MRKLNPSACVWLLLVLFIFSGCGQAVPRHGGDEPYESPADFDDTLISITSNGETTPPYLYWVWDSSWTGEGWLAADALQLIYALPDIEKKLPIVSYHDDFSVQYKEGVSFSYMLVYDTDFTQLFHIASYDDKDYIECLKELPEGTYYVGIAVVERGNYIESENQYEHSGTNGVFKLVVKQ